jgi:tetratricopeptide (TPR) repeat protein
VGYTKAINLDPNNAVYYSNRAFAHIKLENFGSAISDATKSLELDSTYVKVGWRSSHECLQHVIALEPPFPELCGGCSCWVAVD